MVQFLSINFFFLDFFNIVGFFKSSRFFVSPYTWAVIRVITMQAQSVQFQQLRT